MAELRKIKIAVAGIFHETNTFAPGITTIDDFAGEWIQEEETFFARYRGTKTSIGGIIAKADDLGLVLVPGLYTAATPSAMVENAAAEKLLEAVLESLDEQADGIFLVMHGAMVAETIPDIEGELLKRLRSRFGNTLPVAMTLDLHANISAQMAELADLIVGYDTYPHVDMFERANEALNLLVRMIRKEICPVSSLAKPNMMIVPQGMLTEVGAMKELMEQAFAVERIDGVLNVTVAGGFPYSDVPDAGMSIVVTTDGNRELANRAAAQLAEQAWDNRERFTVNFCTPEEAVKRAFAEPDGPVILAEGSDNVGGGAPADATHVLALLREPPVRCLIVIRDEEAVLQAHRQGVGGRFEGHIGGKSDTLHGTPVYVEGKIRVLHDGVYHHVGRYMTGQRTEMGKTAVIECERLTVVLTEKRTVPWDIGHVRTLGLWPEDYHVLVVKSAIAWQAAFGEFAKSVIHIESPGCCTSNLRHLHYRHVQRRVFPLNAAEI